MFSDDKKSGKKKIISSENVPLEEFKPKREEEIGVRRIEFPNLEEGAGAKLKEQTFGSIPVQVTAELGRTKLSLREILELGEGSIIELDRLAGEPLDLKIGDQLVAKGEVVAVDNSYGLRVTAVYIK